MKKKIIIAILCSVLSFGTVFGDSEIKVALVAPGIEEELSESLEMATDEIEDLETKTQREIASEIVKKINRKLSRLRKYSYFNLSYIGKGIAKKLRKPVIFISIHCFPEYNKEEKKFIDDEGRKVCLGISKRCLEDVKEFYDNIEDQTFLPNILEVNDGDIVVFAEIGLSTEVNADITEKVIGEIQKCFASGKEPGECKRKIEKEIFDYPFQINVMAFEGNSGALYTSLIPITLRFNSGSLKKSMYKAGADLFTVTINSSSIGQKVESSQETPSSGDEGW
ncbi:MAG: hypothetical protein ABGX27_07130 [Desulfurobacteriaceae bacterium]